MNLDVGCGQNKRASLGIDILKTPSVDIVCDAHYLPFINRIFKRCYLYSVLQHVEDPPQVLNEINRVLDNGILELTVPTDSRTLSSIITHFLSFKFSELLKAYMRLKRGTVKHSYCEASLKTLLLHCGFKILAFQKPSVPWIYGKKGLLLTKMGVVRHPYFAVHSIKERDRA